MSNFPKQFFCDFSVKRKLNENKTLLPKRCRSDTYSSRYCNLNNISVDSNFSNDYKNVKIDDDSDEDTESRKKIKVLNITEGDSDNEESEEKAKLDWLDLEDNSNPSPIKQSCQHLRSNHKFRDSAPQEFVKLIKPEKKLKQKNYVKQSVIHCEKPITAKSLKLDYLLSQRSTSRNIPINSNTQGEPTKIKNKCPTEPKLNVLNESDGDSTPKKEINVTISSFTPPKGKNNTVSVLNCINYNKLQLKSRTPDCNSAFSESDNSCDSFKSAPCKKPVIIDFTPEKVKFDDSLNEIPIFEEKIKLSIPTQKLSSGVKKNIFPNFLAADINDGVANPVESIRTDYKNNILINESTPEKNFKHSYGADCTSNKVKLVDLSLNKTPKSEEKFKLSIPPLKLSTGAKKNIFYSLWEAEANEDDVISNSINSTNNILINGETPEKKGQGVDFMPVKKLVDNSLNDSPSFVEKLKFTPNIKFSIGAKKNKFYNFLDAETNEGSNSVKSIIDSKNNILINESTPEKKIIKSQGVEFIPDERLHDSLNETPKFEKKSLLNMPTLKLCKSAKKNVISNFLDEELNEEDDIRNSVKSIHTDSKNDIVIHESTPEKNSNKQGHCTDFIQIRQKEFVNLKSADVVDDLETATEEDINIESIVDDKSVVDQIDFNSSPSVNTSYTICVQSPQKPDVTVAAQNELILHIPGLTPRKTEEPFVEKVFVTKNKKKILKGGALVGRALSVVSSYKVRNKVSVYEFEVGLNDSITFTDPLCVNFSWIEEGLTYINCSKMNDKIQQAIPCKGPNLPLPDTVTVIVTSSVKKISSGVEIKLSLPLKVFTYCKPSELIVITNHIQISDFKCNSFNNKVISKDNSCKYRISDVFSTYVPSPGYLIVKNSKCVTLKEAHFSYPFFNCFSIEVSILNVLNIESSFHLLTKDKDDTHCIICLSSCISKQTAAQLVSKKGTFSRLVLTFIHFPVIESNLVFQDLQIKPIPKIIYYASSCQPWTLAENFCEFNIK